MYVIINDYSQSIILMNQMASEAAENTGKQLSRVERKRQETRTRILVAAEQLMRSKAVDGVTIQDITEAADVGHGSFYLHFKSKNEVLVPIIESYAINWDVQLQKAASDILDPAELMAVSSRYMARVIVADELWKWFLQHSGIPIEALRHALGRFSERDFQKGHQSGRFIVSDVNLTYSYAFGGFVNSLMAFFDLDDAGALIDQSAELMLRVFGISADEAHEIAYRPLPQQLLKELAQASRSSIVSPSLAPLS
jgi:AcrR family transcriptional regulator